MAGPESRRATTRGSGGRCTTGSSRGFVSAYRRIRLRGQRRGPRQQQHSEGQQCQAAQDRSSRVSGPEPAPGESCGREVRGREKKKGLGRRGRQRGGGVGEDIG